MLLLACTILDAQDLTILHLNDTHSHIEPERSGKNKGMGGVIEQAAYIDSVRISDGKGNVMLLHAGDFSQGSSYFSELGGDVEIDVLFLAVVFFAVCFSAVFFAAVFFAAVFFAADFFAADFLTAVFFSAAGSPAGSPSVPSAAVFFL